MRRFGLLCLFSLFLVSVGLGAPRIAGAVLEVEATVTQAPAGFNYAIRVTNGLAFDIVLINLIDAPASDGLIGPSATAPSGYLTSYDAGLGIVDLLEGSSLFAAGGSVDGFSFTSGNAPAPGVFERFEAYTKDAGFVTGAVTVVPEPGRATLLAIGLLALLLLTRIQRHAGPGVPLALVALALASVASGARAGSHSDAPLIAQDPQANITDVYTFVGTRYNDASEKVLNVFTMVRPLSEPGDGPHYERFADDALYSIHITDPSSGSTVIRYDFQFSGVNPVASPGLKNANTILSFGNPVSTAPSIQNLNDQAHNFVQTYSIARGEAGASETFSGGTTPPPNVGRNTTPHYNDPVTGLAISGATSFAELDPYTQQAIWDLPNGLTAFAGTREDGFYADIPGIFDLLGNRILDNDGDPSDGLGQDGGGSDGFKGFNVLAFGLQIPISSLSNVPGLPLVGVFASVSRQRIRLLRTDDDPVAAGAFVQVNRMGNPLFNEAFVALRDKDTYNRTSPTQDAAFAQYARNPELARVANAVFGTNFPETGRTDLAAIYIPDILRVDTGTPPVPLAGEPGFSRLGALGGDKVPGSFGETSSGWPNGRRFGDDVIDIGLSVIASGPDFTTTTLVGDNVDANDQVYHRVFPYAGTPHSGAKHEHFECEPAQ